MKENQPFLTEQLITYIGNKRSLLDFIGSAVELVKKDLKKEKLECLDIFSGSGIVARYLKSFSSFLAVNDLENYANIINRCYLANKSEINIEELKNLYNSLVLQTEKDMEDTNKYGFISELYAPRDKEHIELGERCFYTPYNAKYIDCMRQNIEKMIPDEYKHFFIAPLLSQASVHANTAGIFKGFYKNSKTKLGQFGGNGKDALSRICKKIELPFPVFSENECRTKIFQEESNFLAKNDELYEQLQDKSGKFDLVYLDPPYNQHPYGSNYFMLNLIANYKKPECEISKVSGIPKNWNRSSYNKKNKVAETFRDLVQNLRAKYIIVSFNSEGFIKKDEMEKLLGEFGKVEILEEKYNAFRGSRNLRNRKIHVSEYLFVLKKSE